MNLIYERNINNKNKHQKNKIKKKKLGVWYLNKNGGFNMLESKGKNKETEEALRLSFGVERLQGSVITATRVRRVGNGYVLEIHCQNDSQRVSYIPGTFIGIDFGISSHFTLSNGQSFSVLFKKSRRHIRLENRLAGYIENSQSWLRVQDKIKKEIEKLRGSVREVAGAIVNELLRNETVYIQNDNVSGWGNLNGYAYDSNFMMSLGVITEVMNLLKESDRVKVVEMWEPTTQHCPMCLKNTEQFFNGRKFICKFCEYTTDRDVNASMNMVSMTEKDFPKFKSFEESLEYFKDNSVFINLNSIPTDPLRYKIINRADTLEFKS